MEAQSLQQQIADTGVAAICRYLGRTDWTEEEVKGRGRWVEYPDGQKLLKFDGQELVLFHPAFYDRETDKWVMKVEWLFDKNDYDHHTKEDENG